MAEALIRPAEDKDGFQIGRLIEGVFSEYPGCIFDWSEFPELLAPASYYRARGGGLFVAAEGATIIGSFGIKATTIPGLMELVKVYLRADRRGQGHAQRMAEAAYALAHERGATGLMLFTDTRFVDGHRFYERNGWRRVPGERCLADLSLSWEYHYIRDLPFR